MGIFNRKKEVVIQATEVEGNKDPVSLENLLTGEVVNTSVPGTTNAFKSYQSQVNATYKKYNGKSDFGVAQTRAVIDLRTAMIAGEGISISTEDEALSKWIESLLLFNGMNKGSMLTKAVKGAEMSGQSLFKIHAVKGAPQVSVSRVLYKPEHPYEAEYRHNGLIEGDVKRIIVTKSEGGVKTKIPLLEQGFVYIRTGGDDCNSSGPTTKVGISLTDIENYDRAIKDMRRNNHIAARVTPVFETADEKAAKALSKVLRATRWKIGKAYAGSAKFRYETPDHGAHENLNTELQATIKNITATTGVPVHWLGHVDMMSNRSTADSLYEMIKQATILERTEWEAAIYRMIWMAQQTYIDVLGGEGLRLNPDFQVRIPLLDYSGFLDRVRALNLAYSDDAISMDDYRNFIPGIDPIKTAKAVDAVQETDKINLIPKEKENEQSNQSE